MAGSPRSPLLLLAALALALALAVSPAAGQGHKGRLVGGLIDADVNEEGVQQALSFALSEYNKASNDAYHGRVLRVLRVRKQVVAGMNYFLEVEIGRTTCTKSQANLDNCPFPNQPDLQKKTLCSFQVYTVPWKGTTSLVKSSCRDE
ncbi:cystatin-C [Phacochoerus africanus]|nr:cystatin-C precursor [Sus scrofa]XP_047627528.1 cystatin-C [Phacochoerus africanus]ABG48755.1 cystatin C [Sus scrofa]